MAAVSAVLHGWYRMTDILWEWQKVLPEDVVKPVKSFLHSESMTSPEHPFYNPTLGGVELFIGVLPDHESRMLFSSKQIEYLRYWLHAMGLVDHLIPIPHSEYLLTMEILGSVAPVVIKTAAEMRQQQKLIDKHNRRVRGNVDARLASLRQLFERVRAAYGTCKGTWIALDFEAWELAHEVITEFGFAEVKWLPTRDEGEERKENDVVTTAALAESGTIAGDTNGVNGTEAVAHSSVGLEEDGKATDANSTTKQVRLEPVIVRSGHWIVKENQGYRNGQYCPDNRDRYAFGKSETLPWKEFREKIKQLLDPEHRKVKEEEPIYLIFHDHSQDMAYLTKEKYKLVIFPEPISLTIPETSPQEGIWAIDTSLMFAALEGDSDSRRKLEDVYRRLKHSVQYDFHNSGNDARYTLDVFQDMATGGPLDAQRDRRWPPPPPPLFDPTNPPPSFLPAENGTTTNANTHGGAPPPQKKSLKVQDWRPEDESDYEDTETLLRPDEDWVRMQNAKPIIGKPVSVVHGVDMPYGTKEMPPERGEGQGEADREADLET
ncbi:hypothetical protein FRC18_009270 [Serendipita sp. 400]|nr:hypothetical protein FRC18_009270 [Serendipita sp. 400]